MTRYIECYQSICAYGKEGRHHFIHRIHRRQHQAERPKASIYRGRLEPSQLRDCSERRPQRLQRFVQSLILISNFLNNISPGSKVFAEKAAWKFLEDEHPNFTLATICPPLVVGPITSCIDDASKLNTSNLRILEFITGKYKGPVIPETGNYLWADVRDVALAHVRAFEVDEAAGKRFFTVASHFCNKEIVEILRKNFPEFEEKLPDVGASGGGYPEEGPYGFSNENSTKILGIQFMGFEKSVVDLVKSLKAIGV